MKRLTPCKRNVKSKSIFKSRLICVDCNVSDLDLILICAFVKSRHQGELEADSITSQLTERTGSALTQRLPGALLGTNLAVGCYF